MEKSSGQRYGAICHLWLLGLMICGVLAVPVAVARANDTWTGASSNQQWSDAGNWTAGVPTGAAGTLNFPDLAGCGPPATCYTTQNGLSGITASGLVFDNASSGSQYRISGQTLTVGAGGITDTPGHGTSVLIQTPLALSAGQNWKVGAAGDYNSLNLTAGVTGSSSALTVAFPPLGSGALYVVHDMEVGPVTVDGLGGLHIGGPPTSGHLGTVNATDGNPTTITNGASLVSNPGSRIGPLNIAGGTLLLGTNPLNNVATTLTVSGAAAIDTNSAVTTFINDNGPNPGTDFSQVRASGDITLAGRLNLGQGALGPSNPGCASLSRGDVATLFTTSGTLTGTFANAPQDGLLTLTRCGSSTAPQVRIHYSATSVTATVVSGATTTMTTLAPPDPSPATTNQPVTLTATVTTPTGVGSPAGTVTFSAAGSAIPGCSGRPVTTSGPSATATCTASFAGADSPVALTASFTGATGSGQTGSTSPAQALSVTRGASSTALSASDSSPPPGAAVTYTATVTAGDPGAITPSGAVQFSDGGPAIPGCGNRPLTPGPSGSTSATCTVSYAGAGSHSITAIYGGDANFGGSSSPATSVIVAVPGSPAAASSGPTAPPSTPTSPTPTSPTSTAPTSTSPSSTSPRPTTRAGSSAPSRTIIATTSPATSLGTTKVTLRGRITAGGNRVRWRFQYGRSATYGRATRLRTIAARHGTVTVSVALRQLSPHVRYHYRLEVYPASHGARTRSGRGLTFTTPATGRLTGPAHQLTFTGQTIVVAHRCESAVPCAGRLTLATTIPGIRRSARRATVVCATGEVRIAAHRRARTTFRLTARCLSLVRAQSRHSLSVTDTVQPATGQLELRRRITLVLGQSKRPPVARRRLTQS